MTPGRLAERDRATVEALVADHYLDALLEAADRGAGDAPSDASLAPELRDAARVLSRALVRVHPSFRFEERLASRIAELATAQSRQRATGGPGTVVPFTPHAPLATPARPVSAPGRDAADPLLPAILAGALDPSADDALHPELLPGATRRPLIVGGAITSAAISIVGVAWVAWRASRPARATASPVAATGIGGPA